MSNILRDVKLENFLYGGMIYHHKEVTDLDERNKIFEEVINASEGNAGDLDFQIDNIYDFKAQLEYIKNSQSLTATAMQKTFDLINDDAAAEHPFNEIYSSTTEENANIFVKDGIKIVEGDIIIFLPHNGMVGDIYDHKVVNQKLCIVYNYNEDTEIYTGIVIDQKLYDDFKDYPKLLKEVLKNG